MTLPDLLWSSPAQAGELCAWCKQPSKRQCGGCGTVTYCSGEHQKEHWNQHRDECNAYRVLSNDRVGRYGVATRTLEPGEQVLTELPFVIGPKPDSYVMCLGCYARVDGSTLCSRCRWPVCGPKCEAAPCHAKAECPVFETAKVRFQSMENYMDACPQLNCIAPLRLLLAKDSNPERWESEVKFMETHNEKRRQTPIWENNQINVVEYLRSPCKLAARFDEELIHMACGILEVNSFEVRCPNGSAVQGFYPRTAIMSHNCVPNTSHCIVNSEENRLILRTTVKIEKGSEIYITYTHTLNPTPLRRDHLKQGKFFDCICSRCSDPTELGTNMSSLKCNKCDPGLIMSSDPLDPLAQWKCTHCEFCTPGSAVKRVFSVVQRDLDELDYMDTGVEAVEKREALCRKYRSVLHPKHAFLATLQYSLSQLYGHAQGYSLEDLPDILLQRKLELCKDVLSVADIIEPGLSRLRGLILYELHAPAVLLARNQWRYKEIDDKKLRIRLEEAEKYLKEAVHILKFEHPSSPEGRIAAIGEKSLQQLRESIESLPKSQGSLMSAMVPGDRCAVCEGTVSVLCSQCGTVGYCGPEHRKDHWPEHKTLCTPYCIQRSEKLGRYLVASRDIKAGELILKEKPLVVGPRVDSAPICVACYQPFPLHQQPRCSVCLVAPVCGVHCERNGRHTSTECNILKEAAKKYSLTLSDNSQIVLPLRCLLQLRNSPTDPNWVSFLEMESHVEKRRDTLIWRDHQLNVVDVLRENGLLTSVEDADFVQKICGILDVNSFEVRGPPSKSGQTEKLRGIYLRASLMAHDCVANTHLAVDDDFEMSIHASVPITRGHPIYFNYTSAMQGTWNRQMHLREGKYFDCTCRRCSDPTELGTHMSSLRCVRCYKGFIISTNPIGTLTPKQGSQQVEAVSAGTYWECNKCKHRYHSNLIRTTVSQARCLLDGVDRSDIRATEYLLRRLLRTFPPQHFVILELKQTLVAAYRDTILRDPNPTRKILNRKTELCRDMLPVLQVVEPGISRLRGIALYELQDPIVTLALREMQAGDFSQDLLKRLKEAEGYLREAVTQLLYEPTHSAEGQLGRVAMQDLQRLRYSIQRAEIMMAENGRDHRGLSTAKSEISKKRGGRKRKT